MFTIDKPHNWPQLALYEKIMYYKKHLTEKYAIYVDKIEVKSIVTDMSKGMVKITPIIKILKDVSDFKPEDINKKHILKSAHGSGWNLDLKYADIFTPVFFKMGHQKLYLIYG